MSSYEPSSFLTPKKVPKRVPNSFSYSDRERILPADVQNPHIETIETEPHVRKVVTKHHPDGRTLSLDICDEKIIRKLITYTIPYEYEVIKKEQD